LRKEPYTLKHHRDSFEHQALLNSGQHLQEMYYLHYLQSELIEPEPTESSQLTMSLNINYYTGLLPNRIGLPASCDHHEQSWLQYSRCIWTAINKLSSNNRLIQNILGAPPAEDPPNEESNYPELSSLTFTPDPTMTKAHRQVVGVDYVGGNANAKESRLYSKHRNFSERWSLWHRFRSVHDLQPPPSFSQEIKPG
jgi:hypothetical protein